MSNLSQRALLLTVSLLAAHCSKKEETTPPAMTPDTGSVIDPTVDAGSDPLPPSVTSIRIDPTRAELMTDGRAPATQAFAVYAVKDDGSEEPVQGETERAEFPDGDRRVGDDGEHTVRIEVSRL